MRFYEFHFGATAARGRTRDASGHEQVYISEPGSKERVVPLDNSTTACRNVSEKLNRLAGSLVHDVPERAESRAGAPRDSEARLLARHETALFPLRWCPLAACHLGVHVYTRKYVHESMNLHKLYTHTHLYNAKSRLYRAHMFAISRLGYKAGMYRVYRSLVLGHLAIVPDSVRCRRAPAPSHLSYIDIIANFPTIFLFYFFVICD